MTIRPATREDLPALAELWRAFAAEIPPPDYAAFDPERELREIEEIVRGAIALVAEEAGDPVGFALARKKGPRLGFLSDLYVRPEARRLGVARALVREVVERLQADGVEMLELEVKESNRGASAIYQRWGLRETLLTLAAPVAELAGRLAEEQRPASFGSIHVQTDDELSVERAVRQFVPRLGRSAGTEVTPARNGWISVYDDLCNRDRSAQRRLAGELSDRLGAVTVALAQEEGAVVRFLLFERGRMVDEYLSVPTYYGPLSTADELSLAANPTLVARLTGADPARVRTVARIASAPAELPPAPELLVQIAGLMGLEGAERGYQ